MDYSGGPNVAIKVYSGEGGRKDMKAKTDVTGMPYKKVSNLPCCLQDGRALQDAMEAISEGWE